ncbi:hypothetical protein [Bacillus sp. 3255]|uniref:hypothetical protein n=1 Tax=Bacillus sp. 3255 TaxID=2817904 RepID=UPI00285A0A45|nr:hypothetical protein [Bacillus sp. 3255]MDR6883057.1 hypothetical protein [Bacillus sp. 3255]
MTNDEERQLMQSRIIKASIVIEDMPDSAERTRLVAAYDEMVRIMKAYDRAQYCKQYPGVRTIYEQLGWVVADVKTEQRDTSVHDVTENIKSEVKSNSGLHEQPDRVEDDTPDWL